MYRRRLRETPTDAEFAELYPHPHDHLAWGAGHSLRVDATIALGRWFAEQIDAQSIGDLSTGNGSIPFGIGSPFDRAMHLGDFAPGWDVTGPIEETIRQIPPVDLFVCSETIEHLDDPDSVLAEIRGKCRGLLLSTPIGETGNGNPEHVWGWDQEAVGLMLADAGFDVARAVRVDVLIPDSYSYMIWAVT